MCGERCVCPCDVCVHGMACRPPRCPMVPAVAEGEEVTQEEEEEEDRRVRRRGKRMRMRTRTTSL